MHNIPFWTEGYDSPIVLDEAKLFDRLVYFYVNPQRERLVDTIEEYCQINSWAAFLSDGAALKTVPTFPRTAVPKLEGKFDDLNIFDRIIAEKNGEAILAIEPFAWQSCFPDSIRLRPDASSRKYKKECDPRRPCFDEKRVEALLAQKSFSNRISASHLSQRSEASG